MRDERKGFKVEDRGLGVERVGFRVRRVESQEQGFISGSRVRMLGFRVRGSSLNAPTSRIRRTLLRQSIMPEIVHKHCHQAGNRSGIWKEIRPEIPVSGREYRAQTHKMFDCMSKRVFHRLNKTWT